MKDKTEEIIAVLDRGRDLLGRIDDDLYGRRVEVACGGTLGGHFRHDLDHYVALFDGLATGRIDYEARTRDQRVETDRMAAIARSMEISERLARLAASESNRPVLVRQEGSGSGPEARWVDSSLGRELDFLLGHTVHHQALTAIICRILDLAVDEDFGVAPSTLRHRERTRACVL